MEASALMQWKPGIVRNIALRIVSKAIEEKDRIFWADDIDFAFVPPTEINAVGMAWRRLLKDGIISRTNLHRRSTKKGARGRVIFKYRLADKTAAEAFLKRNDWTGTVTANGERLLFPQEQLNGNANKD